jgi:hypothetical protein
MSPAGVWRAAALEPLGDDHAAAAARTRLRKWLGLVGLGAAVVHGLGLCRRQVEQTARLGDVVGKRRMNSPVASVMTFWRS